MKEVAVIGAGMTLSRRHLQETGKELSYLATKMAMEDTGIQKDEIDMVVMGSAPDAFDGIHMKGENLIDGSAPGETMLSSRVACNHSNIASSEAETEENFHW